MGQHGENVRSFIGSKIAKIEDQAKKEDFKDNIHAQSQAMQHISRIWSGIGPEQQNVIAKSLAPYFPRCAEAPKPEMAFRLIAELPTAEDINRALLVRGHLYKEYLTTSSEEIYPTTGWIGRYLNYAKHNHIPLAFHFWSAVGALGMACRRNFFLDRRLFSIHLNQYLLLTGVKSTGKSEAANICINMIYRLNRQIQETQEYRIRVFPQDATQEFIVDELAKLAEPRAYTDPESGFVEWRSADTCAVIWCDELSVFLGKQAHAVSKKIPFLTSIMFSGRYSKGTMGGGEVEIENLSMSLLACTAPEWMRNTIHTDAIGGGFLDRCTLIFREPVKRRCYPPNSELPPLDPVQAEQLAKSLVRLTRPAHDDKTMIELSPEADEWLGHWYRGSRDAYIDRAKDEAHAMSIDRAAYQILRLAAILAISEEELPWISMERLSQAVEIIEHESHYVDQFMDRARERPDALFYDQIITYVRDMKRPVAKHEITQKFKRRIGPSKEVMQYVNTLVEARELKVAEQTVLTRATYYLVGLRITNLHRELE